MEMHKVLDVCIKFDLVSHLMVWDRLVFTQMVSGNKILGHAKAMYQWVYHLLSLHEGNPINLRYPLLQCLGRVP